MTDSAISVARSGVERLETKLILALCDRISWSGFGQVRLRLDSKTINFGPKLKIKQINLVKDAKVWKLWNETAQHVLAAVCKPSDKTKFDYRVTKLF